MNEISQRSLRVRNSSDKLLRFRNSKWNFDIPQAPSDGEETSDIPDSQQASLDEEVGERMPPLQNRSL